MFNNNQRYAYEQLGTAGFVIEDYAVAEEIRPDFLSSRSNTITFPSDVQRAAKERRATAYRMSIGGKDVVVWSKSTKNLEDRIENVVGAKVVMLGPVDETPAAPGQGHDYWQARKRNLDAAEDERTRKLAAETPPAHDCARRREILEAREKVGGAA